MTATLLCKHNTANRERPWHRPDGKRAWLVCICATVANGWVHSVVLSFGVMLPILMKEFKTNKESTALVGSLAYAIGCFTAPIAARLCDKISYQRTHVLGSLACAIALFSSSWTTQNMSLYFSYSVPYGIGMSSVFMPCFLVVSKYFRRHRSLAVGMVTAGPAAGILVMGPLLQALVEVLGWRNSYRMLSGIFVLSCGLSCLFDMQVAIEEEESIVLENNNTNHQGNNHHDNESYSCQIGKVTKFVDLSVCKIQPFVISLFSMCFAGIGHFSPPIHLVRYCEEIGYTAQAASFLFISIGIGSVVGRLVAGKICDFSWISPICMNQLSMVCSGTVIVLLTIRGGYPVLVFLTLLYGLADGIYMTTFNVIIVKTVGADQRSHAFGIANMALASCVCSAPPLTGLIADRLSYKYAFYVSGGIAVMGAIIPFYMKLVKQTPSVQSKAVEYKLCSGALVERVTVL